MSTKCPLCGDSKSKDSLFCAACTERLNSEYEVDVPTAEPSEEHTDSITPNSKEKEEKGSQLTPEEKKRDKEPSENELQGGREASDQSEVEDDSHTAQPDRKSVV